MSAFEDDLKGLFAQEADLADDGFSVAVSARIGARERLQAIMRMATYAGYAFTVLAIVFVCFGIVGRLLPASGVKLADLSHAAGAPTLAVMAVAPLLAAFGVAFAAVAYAQTRD